MKDPLENAIEEFAKKDKPTQVELNKVTTVAKVQAGLDKYRQEATRMSRMQFEVEVHHSARLSRFMESSTGRRRPRKCHAHAIVSGGHWEAAQAGLA